MENSSVLTVLEKGEMRMLKINGARVEYLTNPICVPCKNLRFSWSVECDLRDQSQAAYQLLVWDEGGVVWDSGKVLSDTMVGVLYQGQPLFPRAKYFWKVKIWTKSGECSDFSAVQSFETTLSDEEWENAAWVGAETQGLPALRKTFTLSHKKITQARAYVCGLGVYQCWINGRLISDALLNPMITRYHKRYFYNAYDITNLLCEGENAVGILLGNGYYSMNDNGADWQKTNWATAVWADAPKCKTLLYITYADGTESVIATDESWKTAESCLHIDEAYYGEEQDNRLLKKEWTKVNFDDVEWKNAVLVKAPQGKPQPQLAEPCKVVKTLPLHLLKETENSYLFDTKEMTTGWAKLLVDGENGAEIEVSYSEWLDEDGDLSVKNLLGEWDFQGRKRLPQTDYFILRGEGEETLSPYFQYKGFRYVKISIKGKAMLKEAFVETVYADLTEIGQFSCSNDFLNRLNDACKNSLRCNLHSYPSDTPVYENLGYLADGYLTQKMAHFYFDATKYYEKWARDILDQVKENGYIEQTAPMWDEDKENATEWSVGAAIVPYQLYLATGDKTLLFEGYQKTKRVFDYQMSLTKDGIATSMWGDHISVSGRTIKEISATAQLFYMANILAKTAKWQGQVRDYDNFQGKAEKIKEAFNARFYDEEKGYYHEVGNADFLLSAQVIPFALGLADEMQKQRLTENVTKCAGAFDGGIFGVKSMMSAMPEMGLNERLYAWVTEENYPSWGYFLSSGDGSLWEQWERTTRSRNHHMFGTVTEWLYQSLAGLELIDGQCMRIKPFFAEDLQWASASTNTLCGKAACRWERRADGIILSVEVPFNMRATVDLPLNRCVCAYKNGEMGEVLQGGKFEIGSGNYVFLIK